MGSKVDSVSMELLQDIEEGRLPLNSRLPTENKLCERFGCSRNTVRKGIRWLLAENKVECIKNSGVIVKAQSKKRNCLNTVSVMLPNHFEFFSDIQSMILHKGHASGLFFQDLNNWDTDTEAKFLNQVLEQRHRALLAFCSPKGNVKNKPLLRKMADAGIRVVHIDVYDDSTPEGNYCVPDYVRAGRAAAAKLMLAKYEKFYYCGFVPTPPLELLLERGFFEALSDQGRGTAERRELFSSRNSANYFNLKEFGYWPEIEDNPDVFIRKLGKNCGILCGTNSRAIKLTELLRKNNIRVPEDVGVIGVEILFECKKKESRIDYVSFDRTPHFQLVIDEITKFHFNGIQKLMPPKMISNGTVKK